MKTLCVRLASLVGILVVQQVFAQNTVLPVVTIWATDPIANESGDQGLFTVSRHGPTNGPLHVFYVIGGTASNGVDYATLSNYVTIPAGSSSAFVHVEPLLDNLVEGPETVQLRLSFSPVGVVAYTIGSPSNAVVTIFEEDIHLPIVTIVASDPVASEPGANSVLDPGIFTITRSGGTNHPLLVHYVIGGTAGNGSDYVAISNAALIPEGHFSTRVVINPLHDLLPEGTETVALHLVDPVCVAIWPPPPECYRTGIPNTAVVSILDDDHGTNVLPVVTIVAADAIATEGTNCIRWPGWSNTTFTNGWFTNTATFLVRRSGVTNSPLTVRYEIGGTASNGIDYAALSGEVTIPAGRRFAEIVIVPVEDNLREDIETVLLGLRAPPLTSNTPPAYLVGVPRRAGAIIVDNDRPRPVTSALPDRSFHFAAPGVDGSWFSIECSTNLVDWTPLCTNSVTDGALHFVDPEASEMPQRFYRALPLSEAPVFE